MGLLDLFVVLVTSLRTYETIPYPSNSGEVVFQIPTVDAVAQARDMEIVTGILTPRRSATAGALV